MNKEKTPAEVLFDKAFDITKQNEYEEALYFYNKAIALDPTMKKAYSCRAQLYLDTEQYQKALDDYNFLTQILEGENYLDKRAFCYEKLGYYENALSSFLEAFIKNVDIKAFDNVCEIAKAHPELHSNMDILKIQNLIEKYKDEARAKAISELATDFDAERKNYFLDLAISLLPENSLLFYEFYQKKADVEIFLYRLCFDETFRQEIKQANNFSDEQLDEIYKYNAENVSSANLVFAVQRLNEATKYAKNLDEVNTLDEKIADIISLINNNKS